MKKKLLKLSLITFIIAIFVLAFNYYFFHFVTDAGFTLTWHEEAGKPFVTNMLGTLSVLLLFSSLISLLLALIVFNDEEKK